MVTNVRQWLRLFAVLAAASAGQLGCQDESECRQDLRRVENVVRVFMHGMNDYSVLIAKPGGSELEHVSLRRRGLWDVRLVADVAAGDPLWAQDEFTRVKNGECRYDVVLHIHAPSDINGGGWNHGKYGSGQTNVVE